MNLKKKRCDDTRGRPDKSVEGGPPLLYTHTACGNLVKFLNLRFPGEGTVSKIFSSFLNKLNAFLFAGDISFFTYISANGDKSDRKIYRIKENFMLLKP